MTYRNGDILAVNETHLKSGENLEIEGYRWLGHNRAKQHVRAKKAYGGVGMFIKDWLFDQYLISEEYNMYDDMYGVLFQNKHTDFNFMVYSIYLPPENSPVYNDAPDFFNKVLLEVYKNIELDAIYFVGDINARVGGLKDYTELDSIAPRVPLDDTINNHGKAFCEFLTDSKCCVINGRVTPENDNYTYISSRGKSVVDYFFTTHDNVKNISHCFVDTCSDVISHLGLQTSISDVCKAPDHSLLSIEIQTSIYEQLQSRMLGAKNYNNPSTERYKVKKLPDDFMKSEQVCSALCQLIDQINLSRETQQHVDKMYEKLLSIIVNEMREKLSPVSKCGRRKNTPYKPYWDENLSSLWKVAHEKEVLYVRYRGTRHVKQSLRQAFTIARNKFDKLLRQRKRAYQRGLLIDIETCDTKDPRKFWNYIQKLGPRKKNSIPWEVYDEFGNICSDRETVLKKWKTEYCHLLNDNPGSYDEEFYEFIIRDKEHQEREMQDPLYNSNNDLNKPLEFAEVEKMVNRAKSGKSAGTDGIPNEVLKSHNVIKCLHVLFQLCFDSGLIPSIWTQSIICPIPKNKTSDPRVPLNYRGLSILSCVYKIYTAILNNRILSYLEENDLLHDEQNGFRSKRSCTDHIFSLCSIIKNSMNSDQDIFACFVDFRKAFDFVPRDMLLHRLLELGVDGKIYYAIRGVYMKASCSVKINGTMSDWFDTSQGLKQGDNFSPTAFAAYLNPLLTELKSSNIGVQIGNNKICVLAYADDLVLISECAQDLQKLLDILYEWCHKWRLIVNTDKTKVMHFRSKAKPRSTYKFNVNGDPLEYVCDYKYLGTLLNEHLDYTKTAELLSSAAGRALGAVINKVRSNKDLGYKTYSTLVDNCVMPILLYSSGVWGSGKFKCCEDVILRACRFFIGVHRLTPIPGIQGDCGWLDFKSRCTVEMIRLYNRFITMDASRLNRAIFMNDKDKSSNNWSAKFKNILNDLQLTEKWTRNEVIPLELAKNKINEKFLVDWTHQCSTKPKLRTYVTFKDNVDVAAHISCNLPKYERSLISQIRLGILPLRIETGRYVNLKENERICLLCEKDCIENEAHFLFDCDLYNNERNQFETDIGIIFSDMNTENKFRTIFEHPFMLGKFMKAAVNKRKQKLYKV